MGELAARSALPTDVEATRASLQAVLTRIGDDSLTGWLGAAGRQTGERAKVLFAGQLRSGKSSLINALLDRSDLLPAGALGATTTAYVAVGFGTPERVRAELGDGRAADDDLAALAGYVSGAQSLGITRAAVFVDDPRLEALTLFDTPGLGNPNTSSRRLILDVLSEVTALVFVCPAGRKISPAERDFLVEAGQRVDRIIFVLSKIDELSEWRDSLRENEATIRGDENRFPDGRFARLTFIPVSAKNAINPVLRSPERSFGIDELWSELDQIAADHARLDTLNELRILRSVTSEAHVLLGRRLQAISDATMTEATSFEDQLTSLAAQDRAWRGAFGSEVAQARSAVHLASQQRVINLRSDYHIKTADSSTEAMAAAESRLAEDLAVVQKECYQDLAGQIADLAGRLMAHLPGADAALEMIEAELSEPGLSMSSYVTDRPPTPTNPAERVTQLQTTFAGWSMTSAGAGVILAALTPPGAAVAIPAALIGIPGALAWRYWTKHVRERTAETAHAQTWIRDSITQAGVVIEGELNIAFSRGTQRLQEAIEKAMVDARAQLDEVRRMHEQGHAAIEAEKARIRALQVELVKVGRACDKQRSALTT